MSSSRIEGADPATGARDGARTPSWRPFGWAKRVLPRTLLGRSILIIVMPLILVQVIATWVFYDRHWDTIARRLSGGVAGDIGLVIETFPMGGDKAERELFFEQAASVIGIRFSYHPGVRLPPGPAYDESSSIQSQLARALDERVRRPFHIRHSGEPRHLLVTVQLPGGTLDASTPRELLYSSTTYIFVLWMVGSSIVFFAVATVFMRNQVRALRRLAAAADSFGKGRSVPGFKLEGATEIRQAAAAFLAMRGRIQRQIRQRTEMLAGVSHDLRTPLTRMKLALALIGDGLAIDELKSDVADMERMVQGYLDFARGEGAEEPVETDLGLLLEDIAADARRDGFEVSLAAPADCVLPLRPNAMKRCLANLVSNARRHGSHVWLAAVVRRSGVDIVVDDDGPGIPPEQREAVFRPFFRLDASRNPATGGVGLGLTIARDVVRGHGGDLTLDTSPQGGLRACVHLPL